MPYHALAAPPALRAPNNARRPATAAAAQPTSLESWCASSGVCRLPSPLEVFSAAGYRGLRATRDLQEGELLFRVPVALCLHSQTHGRQWPFAGASATDRLAAALLAADRLVADDRPLQPWLDILPRDLDSLGLFRLSAQQLAEETSGYSPLLSLAAREAAKDAADAPRVLSALGLPPTEVDSYSWAAAIVRTRAFELGRSASDGCVLSFVPWLDMLNHACDPSADWGWDGDGMAVHATRRVAAGDELTVCYGQRDNDGFLLWGGFVVRDNAADTVQAFASLREAAHWWAASAVGPALGGTSLVSADQAAALADRVDAAVRIASQEDVERGGGEEQLREAVHLGWGWQVDERLVELFEQLGALDLDEAVKERAAVAAVRLRAAQLLNAWPAREAGAAAEYVAEKRRILAGYSAQQPGGGA